MSLVFAHPALAATTVGLATIPVVIHWLSRRRFRQEPWAAMAFLLAAQQRSRRRMRFEHWLLMILRTLIVCAVGFAIARPALSDSALARAVGSARFDRLIILDDTLSMQAKRTDGKTTFDAARDMALRLIDGFNPRDGVAIVTLADGGKQLVDRPTIDRALVKRLLAQTKCTFATGRPSEAFAIAHTVLARGDAPRDCKSVYILTDAQSATWRESTNDNTAPTGSRFQDLASADQRFVFNLSGEPRGNAAVTALRPATRWVSAGLPATLVADVQSHGLTLSADAAMEWWIDGKKQATIPLNVPNTAVLHRTEFQHHFDKSGPHVVKAKLLHAGDALAVDDERSLSVDAAANVPILIVSGESTGGPAGDPAFYLTLALSPGIDGTSLFASRAITEVELPTVPLDEFRAIVLADVRRLSATDWTRLARFVRGGGGLLVCMGEHVDAASYNAQAGPRADRAASGSMAADLLPLTLERSTLAAVGAEGLQLRAEDWTHPALADLADHASGGLLSTPVRGYMRAARGESSRVAGARTVLSFTNGDPALVEQTVGSGRVMLWTSSMQMDWSALPAKPDFVPLMVNIAAYLACDRTAQQNVLVGQMLTEPLSRERINTEQLVRRPDGREDHMRIVESAQSGMTSAVARYTRTDVPGPYYAVAARDRSAFAVNTDPAESDLTSLGEPGLKRALDGSFVYLNEPATLLHRAAIAPRREMSGALIGILLALVLTETLLAAWFGYHL